MRPRRGRIEVLDLAPGTGAGLDDILPDGGVEVVGQLALVPVDSRWAQQIAASAVTISEDQDPSAGSGGVQQLPARVVEALGQIRREDPLGVDVLLAAHIVVRAEKQASAKL